MNEDNGIETSNKDEHDASVLVWVKDSVYSLAKAEFVHIHRLAQIDCRTCTHCTGKYCGSVVACTNADQWKQVNSLQLWKEIKESKK